MTEPAPAPPTRLSLAAIAVVALLSAAVFLPVTDWLLAFVVWVRGLGAVGVLVYALAYIVASVLMMPGSILTLGAGFLYGPIWGIAVASPVSVIAATVSFLLGRTVAREAIRGRIEANPRFAAIDEAVGREGFKLVALLRLSPAIPFTLMNYVFGLTGVKTSHYILGSWVGMFLGTFMYVYFGSLVSDVTQLAAGAPEGASGAKRVLLGVGLVATIAVSGYVTKLAREALAKILPEDAMAPMAAA